MFLLVSPGAFAQDRPTELPVPPRADCGPGARPEPGLQGRVPADVPDDGYVCNTELVSHEGSAGGFKVERFVDKAGRQCAYYDTTLLFPTQAIQQLQDQSTGVAVVDMTDPDKPVRTDTLVTPAMQTPHESLVLSETRGLLVAVMGNPAFNPGFVDIYDVNEDCRHPELQSSLPVGLLGHESGFAPDGNTFYATSLFNGTVTAVDVTDPKLPRPIGAYNYPSHGFALSNDGNRGYVAAFNEGLIVVDTSQIQAREPSPQMPEISRLDWSYRSVPQINIPVTIGHRRYLVEVDEFATDEDGNYQVEGNGPRVGAARIIDISDETAPSVVSDIRLEVNQPKYRDQVGGDPGASSPVQGYAAHYCGVPTQADPGIVACSFILSGLRVFDIRDPYHPREVAYFVAPPGASPVVEDRSNFAMSKPVFDAARRQVWYSDGNSGLYAVRLTNGAWPDGPPPRCVRRRSFVLPLSRRLRRARVTIDGRRVKVRRWGERLQVRVSLRGKRVGELAVVRITGRTRAGKRVRTRRYRACAR
ncbi:MAG: LVIVD repeat-containing protein [Thermoleophilaceae bacterium]